MTELSVTAQVTAVPPVIGTREKQAVVHERSVRRYPALYPIAFSWQTGVQRFLSLWIPAPSYACTRKINYADLRAKTITICSRPIGHILRLMVPSRCAWTCLFDGNSNGVLLWRTLIRPLYCKPKMSLNTIQEKPLLIFLIKWVRIAIRWERQ